MNTFSEFKSKRPLYPIKDFVSLSFRFVFDGLFRSLIGFMKNIFCLLGAVVVSIVDDANAVDAVVVVVVVVDFVVVVLA